MGEEMERNAAQRIVNLWLSVRSCKLGVWQESGHLGGKDMIHPELKQMIKNEALAIAAACDINPEGGTQ